MAGAIAGTAILHQNTPTEHLSVLAVTVNNSCNLACPHCYLQYDGPVQTMDDWIVSRILRSSARRLAIVGKEPLVSDRVADVTQRLIAGCANRGVATGLITNGVGLRRLSADALRALDYVDVSFDGGPETYGRYRGVEYRKLLQSIERTLVDGLRQVNALHVLSDLTTEHVDDMAAVAEHAPFSHILFSPYLATNNDGQNVARVVDARVLVEKLAGSVRFLRTSASLLLVDGLHLDAWRMCAAEFEGLAQKYDLSEKVLIVDADPLELGYMRVSYDGWALAPLDSLHPRSYRETGIRLCEAEETKLEDVYSSLIARAQVKV